MRAETSEAAPDTGPDAPKPGERFSRHLLYTLLLLCLPWTVLVAEQTLNLDLKQHGLRPGDPHGLWGLLTMPFLHGDLDHLVHNSFALFVLTLCAFSFYPRLTWRVLLITPPVSGLLMWLCARPANHIGASGVVYSLSAFLFLSGVLRRDRGARAGALITALLYGGSWWGVFPLVGGVSWEGHLFGALVGAYLALLFRDVDLPAPDEISDDEPAAVPGDDRPRRWRMVHDHAEDPYDAVVGVMEEEALIPDWDDEAWEDDTR